MQHIAKQIHDKAEALSGELEKFSNAGNAAAGTRARKILQEIKTLCAKARKEIQDKKNTEA